MYKVLNCMSSSDAIGKARIQYKEFCWNTAPDWLAEKGYHPLVFRKLKDAIEWGVSECDEVWEVSTYLVTEKLPPRLSLFELALGVTRPACIPWPKGSVMAQGVWLLKRVK